MSTVQEIHQQLVKRSQKLVDDGWVTIPQGKGELHIYTPDEGVLNLVPFTMALRFLGESKAYFLISPREVFVEMPTGELKPLAEDELEDLLTKFNLYCNIALMRNVAST